MNKLISFSLFILFGIGLYSQPFTVIDYNENSRVIKSQNIHPLVFTDYDNKDSIWISYRNDSSEVFNIHRIDENMNISTPIISDYSNILSTKYNNKLYGYLNLPYRANYFFLDTAYFKVCDINGNTLISKIFYDYTVDYAIDSLNYSYYDIKMMFTNSKNMLFATKSYKDTNKFISLKVIDTNGLIINQKNYNVKSILEVKFDIFENQTEYVLLNNYQNTYYDRGTWIYKLDKETLNTKDSVFINTNFLHSNDILVEDSIILGYEIPKYGVVENDVYMEIRRININTGEYSQTKVNYEQYPKDLTSYKPAFGRKLDYLTTDSIYFVHALRVNTTYGEDSSYMEILNFSKDGEINIRERIDFLLGELKQINGIKATPDGGVLINVVSFGYGYVLKYMPNGFVSITNIETNEKASIKVYPNPSKDFINVDIEADRFSSSEIELFDIQGRLVKKSKLNAQIGNRIDVSTLNPGAYTYRVVINGKGISGKVIIGE